MCFVYSELLYAALTKSLLKITPVHIFNLSLHYCVKYLMVIALLLSVPSCNIFTVFRKKVIHLIFSYNFCKDKYRFSKRKILWKPPMYPLYAFPPYLNYVAALPSEIWKFKITVKCLTSIDRLC